MKHETCAKSLIFLFYM